VGDGIRGRVHVCVLLPRETIKSSAKLVFFLFYGGESESQ
jgi:hypothetical protein